MVAPAFSARPCILTINGGSSSIKFAIFEVAATPVRLVAGELTRIGQPKAKLVVKSVNGTHDISSEVNATNHLKAVDVLVKSIEKGGMLGNLAAVGHRLVHGGPDYWQPQLVSVAMMKRLQQSILFDPDHMPQELLLAEAFRRLFPVLPQIACFDTAFHHDLPRVARVLPIPRRYEALGIRRYGFHGLSYAFLMDELRRLGDPAATKGRVILAHLGSGASLAAVANGKSIDTSMSFTPAAGIPMSTRSGDIDPGLVGYLAHVEKMTPKQFNDLVNVRSGLLGVSETSADMHDLLDRETLDVRAAEAIALFCYEAKKRIGSYAAALGGVDTLVFAGGIGENASSIRERVCAGLGFLGIEIEEARNVKHAAQISSNISRVTVRVIHTDEERMIAKSVIRVLHPSSLETNDEI